jgi:hypothetical protein
MFWFSLQILSETFLILSRIQRDIINVYSIEHVLFLSDSIESLIFSTP